MGWDAERSDDLHPSARVWRRHSHARALLDDTRLLATLRRTCDLMDAHAPPRALCLAGCETLAHARQVGFVAGSYNPVTQAHLALALAACGTGGLDAVIWVIAARTVDKERVERATLPDRLAQLTALTEAYPDMALGLVNRGLYVEQAEALHTIIAPTATLSIVVGFDKITQIFDRRYYTDRDTALERLFTLAHILVAPRAGQGASELAELLARPANARFAHYVRFLSLTEAHARDSSTEVRELARVGTEGRQAVRALVPPEGMALIETGAFDAPGSAPASRYEWRERWEQALGLWDVRDLDTPPPLSTLAAIADERTERGVVARHWLRNHDAATRASVARELTRPADSPRALFERLS